MAREKKWIQIQIRNVEYEIAVHEAFGRYDEAAGIRGLFRNSINDDRIQEMKKEFESVMKEG